MHHSYLHVAVDHNIFDAPAGVVGRTLLVSDILCPIQRPVNYVMPSYFV